METNGGPYVLGIDLGTTSVKVSLLRRECGSVMSTVSKATKADVLSDIDTGSEQTPSKIFSTLQQCLSELPEDRRRQVTCIGVTGQMHGVVLWKKLKCEGWYDPPTSTLYTWQDQRCTTEFLGSLPQPDSHLPLSTGHGCATLCWLHRDRPEVVAKYTCSGTIMDLLVALLCGLATPITTVQLAASFGFYNTKTMSWNKDILRKIGFPVEILPTVQKPGHVAGNMQYDWMGISKGTPILAALGDVQCAVFSVVTGATDAVLNMSTSSQMMFPVRPEGGVPDKPDVTSPIQYFPYFDGSYLAMAASLNGGNVLSHMVAMLQQWFGTFGFNVAEDDLWTKLLQVSSDASPGPVIVPTLYGERHLPEQQVSVSGLTRNNLDLGSIFRSLCKGLIANLCDMMPESAIRKHGITTIIATGSVVDRNPVIREEVTQHYEKFKVLFGNSCDSATGAALFCVKQLK
ncbi:sedoheptulokinase-like [Mizuhopecten yessoensis]|uniref:Sedoheptulokinase n=1 Tax=Mizuhopecten yessoensis TaxID=6573 RepID=A0A210Q7Z6_MIZYE|nr:sedoheptulokinase-like [Mizuhopecten yessoensis]XP_021364935.1 sedoheptulokinase-like [Mizuhopecten yessoensis]XP_021364936.1 sedoheptulokinase-like [Mizuhopecten yessoensis]OWF44809.1 Sedoheptulokinase [Mizuhopecten yessoensis]